MFQKFRVQSAPFACTHIYWHQVSVEPPSRCGFQDPETPGCLLCHPSHAGPKLQFNIEVDASDVGVGAVLSHHFLRGNRVHPCAFFNPRKLSRVKSNYNSWMCKLLNIKLVMEEGRHWLEVVKQPFLVWKDHKKLQYISTTRRFNSHQTRWALVFNHFSFTLSFCPPRTSNQMPTPISSILTTPPKTLNHPASYLFDWYCDLRSSKVRSDVQRKQSRSFHVSKIKPVKTSPMIHSPSHAPPLSHWWRACLHCVACAGSSSQSLWSTILGGLGSHGSLLETF